MGFQLVGKGGGGREQEGRLWMRELGWRHLGFWASVRRWLDGVGRGVRIRLSHYFEWAFSSIRSQSSKLRVVFGDVIVVVAAVVCSRWRWSCLCEQRSAEVQNAAPEKSSLIVTISFY